MPSECDAILLLYVSTSAVRVPYTVSALKYLLYPEPIDFTAVNGSLSGFRLRTYVLFYYCKHILSYQLYFNIF
jgi:hypothetical protein